MEEDRESGKIILINGVSSSGKSTLARAVQERAPVPFWHFSFDHLRDSNALPMTRIRNVERLLSAWESRRPPSIFDRLAAGNCDLVNDAPESLSYVCPDFDRNHFLLARCAMGQRR